MRRRPAAYEPVPADADEMTAPPVTPVDQELDVEANGHPAES
jgi:hypothetical protein